MSSHRALCTAAVELLYDAQSHGSTEMWTESSLSIRLCTQLGSSTSLLHEKGEMVAHWLKSISLKFIIVYTDASKKDKFEGYGRN